MITCLPLLVIMFAYGCDRNGGYNPFTRLFQFLTNINKDDILYHLQNWSYGSALIYLGVVLQLAVYSHVLPGEEVKGVPLRDGTQLTYKVNGKDESVYMCVCEND